MLLRSIAIIASVAILASFASADPILSLDAPSVYAPGTPFHVYAVLTGAQDLASFSMDVVLSCPQGVAGIDYYFSGAAKPSSRYVFLDCATGGFSYGFPPPPAGHETITIQDLLISPPDEVNTLAGTNDRVADLTVDTLPSCTGALTLSFDKDWLYVDNAIGDPVPDYGLMVQGLAPATVGVPEPVSLVFLAGGLTAMWAARRSAARVRR